MGDRHRIDGGAGGRRPEYGELCAGIRRVDAPRNSDDLPRLVEQASTGDDEAAVARLTETIRERALRHAIRFGRKTGAEDTAQNVVVDVLETLSSDSEALNPATIGGFVAVLARRDWKDERERRARHASADLPSPDRAGDLDPAEEAARDETRAAVLAALAGLSEEDRHLVELQYWKGLSQHEIARRLGMAQKSVARWLERVKAGLRRYLREPRSDPGRGARLRRGPPS